MSILKIIHILISMTKVTLEVWSCCNAVKKVLYYIKMKTDATVAKYLSEYNSNYLE